MSPNQKKIPAASLGAGSNMTANNHINNTFGESLSNIGNEGYKSIFGNQSASQDPGSDAHPPSSIFGDNPMNNNSCNNNQLSSLGNNNSFKIMPSGPEAGLPESEEDEANGE